MSRRRFAVGHAPICAIMLGMVESSDTATRANPPTARVLKIYGERNTGTSYLRQLLVRNLEIDCLPGTMPRRLQRLFPHSERVRDLYFRMTTSRNLGWKHAIAPKSEMLARARRDVGNVVFVTLTKNPYAWLLSLYRRPYHAARHPDRFADFLSESWRTVGRENARRVYANPIVLWNEKNASYLALGKHATTRHCRYEDLIRDPAAFVDDFARVHGIRSRGSSFRNVMEATKGSDHGRTFDDYRDYYANERWREDLDDDCVRRINAELDPEIMNGFDYSFLAP